MKEYLKCSYRLHFFIDIIILMFKLTKVADKLEKGRNHIVYSIKNTQEAEKFYSDYIENKIKQQYKTYIENNSFERNALFYIDLTLKTGDFNDMIVDKIIHFTWKSDYHLMAYTYDIIFDNKNSEVNNNWVINDFETILNINDEFSKHIYMFTRWAEKKLTYAIKFLTETNNLSLKDIDNLPLKGKYKGYVKRSIGKIVSSGMENNTSIIKSLMFRQKSAFLTAIDVNIEDKIFSFNLNHSIIDNRDNDEIISMFTSLTNLIFQVGNFRNKVSHSEFMLNKRNLTLLKQLFVNFANYAHIFCFDPHERIRKLKDEINNMITKTCNEKFSEEKRDVILKYFEI